MFKVMLSIFLTCSSLALISFRGMMPKISLQQALVPNKRTTAPSFGLLCPLWFGVEVAPQRELSDNVYSISFLCLQVLGFPHSVHENEQYQYLIYRIQGVLTLFVQIKVDLDLLSTCNRWEAPLQRRL